MFSLIKRKNRYSIDSRYGHFTCKEGETLLNGANSSGVYIPHQCTVGTCKSCRCSVDGESVLACSFKPVKNCVLEYGGESTINARIVSVSFLGGDVYEVKLSVPDKVLFPIGSYMQLYPFRENEIFRSYSVVENRNGELTIHVKNHEHGLVSGNLISADPGYDLRISGPFGSYRLPDEKRLFNQCLGVANGSALGVTASLVSKFLSENAEASATLVSLTRNSKESSYSKKISNNLRDKYRNRINVSSRSFDETLSFIDSLCPENAMILVCGSSRINKAFGDRKSRIESKKSILIQEMF